MTTIQFLAILVWIPCLPEPKHLCHERRAFGGTAAVTGPAMVKAGVVQSVVSDRVRAIGGAA